MQIRSLSRFCARSRKAIWESGDHDKKDVSGSDKGLALKPFEMCFLSMTCYY